MHVGEALDALTIAQKAYRLAMNDRGEAQVLDTLGMVHQYMGNETAALVSYSQSLALKAQIGDRYRHRRSRWAIWGALCRRRWDAARTRGASSDLDLQIAKELSDARGQARVLIDLAELERCRWRARWRRANRSAGRTTSPSPQGSGNSNSRRCWSWRSPRSPRRTPDKAKRAASRTRARMLARMRPRISTASCWAGSRRA